MTEGTGGGDVRGAEERLKPPRTEGVMPILDVCTAREEDV